MAFPIPPFRDPKHYRGLSDEDFDELWPAPAPRASGFHRLIVPSFHPHELVKNATKEEREAMLADWERRLRDWNPSYFNEDGSLKKWWRVLIGAFGF